MLLKALAIILLGVPTLGLKEDISMAGSLNNNLQVVTKA